MERNVAGKWRDGGNLLVLLNIMRILLLWTRELHEGLLVIALIYKSETVASMVEGKTTVVYMDNLEYVRA